MAANSIHMLRHFNTQIPIKVIFVSDKSPPQNLIDYSQTYNFEIISKPSLVFPGQEPYFPMNKIYLRDLTEDKILFIDADTFIFGDVNDIFEYYKEFDCVGCWNKWVYSQGWTDDLMTVKPINSGVVLWSNQALKDNYDNLVKHRAELNSGETPLSKWLISIEHGKWNREEFSLALFLERNNVKYELFEPKYVKLIQTIQDLQTMNQSIIFHVLTVQWPDAWAYLNPKPKKKLRPIMKNRKILIT
jgi:hypothetical protein